MTIQKGWQIQMTMREQMAQAIANKLLVIYGLDVTAQERLHVSKSCADTALTAMLKPTEAMVGAGQGFADLGGDTSAENLPKAYQAMIKEAMK